MKSDIFINWKSVSRSLGKKVTAEKIPPSVSGEVSIFRNYMRDALYDVEKLKNGKLKTNI
jgi:hypothetical protein